MTPETIASLINLGAAGAVIVVVILFLNFIAKTNSERQAQDEKRDAEWRDFFTTLNMTNKDDMCQLAETMARMVSALDAHDAQAKQIKATVEDIDRRLIAARKAAPTK